MVHWSSSIAEWCRSLWTLRQTSTKLDANIPITMYTALVISGTANVVHKGTQRYSKESRAQLTADPVLGPDKHDER